MILRGILSRTVSKCVVQNNLMLLQMMDDTKNLEVTDSIVRFHVRVLKRFPHNDNFSYLLSSRLKMLLDIFYSMIIM